MGRVAVGCMVLLSGCFNPDDILPIRGSVEVPGQRVELLRGARCDDLKSFKETNAGDDGAFLFEVFRAQVQSLTRYTLQCVRAQTRFSGGTRAEATIQELGLSTELPRFVDWHPRLSLDGGHVAFVPLDAGDDATAHEAVVRTADGGVSWRQAEKVIDAAGARVEPIVIDERVLQEFEGALTIEASYGRTNDFSSSPDLTQRAAVTVIAADRIPFTVLRAPPSRGAPCDELPAPCPLTDGELHELEFSYQLLRPTLTVRFTTPMTPSLVVVRDVSFSGDTEQVLDDAGRVRSWSEALRLVGFTVDGREVELGTRRVFMDMDALNQTVAAGPLRPMTYSMALPVTVTEPLVAVQLRATSFRRLREVSVF